MLGSEMRGRGGAGKPGSRAGTAYLGRDGVPGWGRGAERRRLIWGGYVRINLGGSVSVSSGGAVEGGFIIQG